LDRVGILKLIYKIMSKTALEVLTYSGVAADEIARFDQQIEKVETAATRFQFLISCQGRLQSLLQKGSEICIVLF
jgi:hypothetical protein